MNKTNGAEKKDVNGNTPKQNEKKNKLKEKVFVERKSLIIELYESQHIRNIHYIFMVFLLTLVINHIVDGIIHQGRLSLHINVLQENFADAPTAVAGWFFVFTLALLVHPTFHLWSYVHLRITNVPLRRSWDAFWSGIVLYFYYRTFAWCGAYVTQYDLSFTSSFSLLIETTRFLMKSHAFIRANVHKLHKHQHTFKMPTLFQYFEFLFLPTLVYRDSYPRTKAINWINVIVYIFELCGVVFFLCYLYNLYFEAGCVHYKTTAKYELKEFVWAIFRNTLPALVYIVLLFYFVLHLWQNLFGELTRFADRQFYQDWWNSTSYDEYYRKWNIVVHDWLYNYIYKDIFETLQPRSTFLPKFLVFLTSAVVHEYVLYYMMRMFYPVLAIMFFTLGMLLTMIRSPKWWVFNVLFLYGYAFGFSIVLTTYTTEYCVRQNPCAANSTKLPFEWFYSHTLFSDCVA